MELRARFALSEQENFTRGSSALARFHIPPSPSSEITGESAWLRRREFVGKSAALAGAALALHSPAGMALAAGTPLEYRPVEKTAARGLYTDEALTPFDDITRYNNFYEFGTDKGDPARFAFPRPMTNRPGLDFSFSGLKTHTLATVEKHGGRDNLNERTRSDIARAFQSAVVDTLVIKCRRALGQERLERLVIAGGVSANRQLRKRLKAALAEVGGRVFYPAPRYCTDNGAMIAYAGCQRLLAGDRAGLDSGVRPRWPMEELSVPGPPERYSWTATSTKKSRSTPLSASTPGSAASARRWKSMWRWRRTPPRPARTSPTRWTTGRSPSGLPNSSGRAGFNCWRPCARSWRKRFDESSDRPG